MENFKAVEFMREQKKRIWKKYEGLALEEAVKKIHNEVETSPIWKDFLKKRKISV